MYAALQIEPAISATHRETRMPLRYRPYSRRSGVGATDPDKMVCARGATLAHNLPLVEWHQGQHETTTSGITDDQLTAGQLLANVQQKRFRSLRKTDNRGLPEDRSMPTIGDSKAKWRWELV
jgi:hypothetical protein